MKDHEKNHKTILLVEDEPITALAGKSSLEKIGYTVITADSGEKAVELFRNNPEGIDLVLMDINLGGGLDGTEAASIILKERTIPVVFLSSHTEPDIVEKTEKITSYGYVVKNTGITVLDASIKMAFKLFSANRTIADNEIKQKAMIESISDVIAIIGTDGRIKYDSPNIEKWFGWKPAERVGNDAWVNVHPDDLERMRNSFENLLKNDNATAKAEFRFRCRDGGYKWIELTARNCINNAAIGGLLLNFHDITERKAIQDALRLSEEMFTKVFQSSPDLIIVTTMDSRIIAVNDTIERVAGFKPEEVLGRTTDDLNFWVNPSDRARYRALFQKQSVVYNFETKYRTRQGKILDALLSGTMISLESGPCFISVIHDISDRKQIEEELREKEKEFRDLVEAAPYGIVIHQNGIIRYVNPAVLRIIRYKNQEEAIGEKLLDRVHPDSRPLVIERIRQQALDGRMLPMVEEKLLRKDGDVCYAEVTTVVGSYLGERAVFAFFADITERKLAEMALSKSKQN